MKDTEKEKIYLDYYNKVFNYLSYKVNNQHIAEDLCSDVFVKVFEHLDSYDSTRSSLSTWIYNITRNTLFDYFRTRKITFELDENIADDTDMDEDICMDEELDRLADALESLDERERDIIILRYYKQLTLKEIAENMGISYAYIKILHNKAIENIKNFFEIE